MAQVIITPVLNAFDERIKAVSRMAAAIQSGDIVRKAGRSLTKDALEHIKALTPRQTRHREPPTSRRGGRPVWKDWASHVIAAKKGQVYIAHITNRASETELGKVIMWSLEAGARRHDMPRGGGERPDDRPYRWLSTGISTRFLGRRENPVTGLIQDYRTSTARGSEGALVKWWGGSHPGHHAFRMVRRTVGIMDPVAAGMGQIVLRELGKIWEGQATVRQLPK